MNFRLDIPRDGEIRVLQLTDMQTIDSSQCRDPNRLCEAEMKRWTPDQIEKLSFSHIRWLVEQTNPDLILITGDITYGEFDDAGTSQLAFNALMEGLGIPWAPVFGNHDNETKMGVDWQCVQYEKAPHCLFDRGTVSGNSNYGIELWQQGELQRVIYMMDSNGCGKRGIAQGMQGDQLEWLRQECNRVHGEHPDTPMFVCYHIPSVDFNDAALAAGYIDRYDTREDFVIFELGVDTPARKGDFGAKKGRSIATKPALLPLFKECGVDGVFVGHEHRNFTSVMYDGVRLTYGLKTGWYDFYDKENNGGTLITLHGKAFSVRHVVYPLKENR
jgi:3',5'-cyclic AMP phosphodiesterase CpdA